MAILLVVVIERTGWVCAYCGHLGAPSDLALSGFCHKTSSGAHVDHEYMWVDNGFNLLDLDEKPYQSMPVFGER